MKKQKFFILDGSSLLYRAYYALPLLESEAGVYTNAIVGFSNMLVKLLNDWQPDYLAIAFDKGKHTFRTDMFAEYKGTRKPMPDELRSQVPMLHEMAEAWGVPLLELAGYEADDIIGTLAGKAVEQGMEAYVVTGDRDALQLVRPDLTVLFTKKGISELAVYDEAAFQAEYEGLAPIQLIDLKGLMGDASDNIPGVPKVGPKTAIKLIAAYGSVEQVLLHIEEISGKALKERLRDNQQQAVLSKQLATIRLDVPVEFDRESFALGLDAEALNKFYGRYNIRSILRHVKKLAAMYAGSTYDRPAEAGSAARAEGETAGGGKGDAGAEVQAAPMKLPEIAVLQTEQEGRSLARKAAKCGSMYLVPVSGGKVPHRSLLAVAVALPGAEDVPDLYYFDCHEGAVADGGMDSLFGGRDGNGMASLFDSTEMDGGEQVEAVGQNPAWLAFKSALSDEKITKCLHGLKDFYHAGVTLSGKIVDLELTGYLLNPSASRYAIEDLADRYGSHVGEKDAEWQQAELAGWQCLVLADVTETMTDRLAALGMTELYEEVELPLVRVLADMEQAGIRVNRRKLQQQTEQVAEKIAALAQEIHRLAGREFNIASPKQLGEVLFEDLALPVIKKTKTGYSTNVEVLNELYNQHPIISKILEYRLWTKLKSTYLDGIAPLIDSSTCRVHTTFNQTVTATGRLSSSEPNLQNIPVRREEGRHIRELFEPGEGYDLLLSADYSQIELRVLADMSQDENFLQAFRQQEDVHARTAAEVFGVAMDEVDGDLRRKAKAVNFGIVYGISDYGLSQDLHIPRAEAKEYIEKYFAKCQGVKSFIDKVVAEAKENGYVLTRYGRRRDLPAIRSSNFNQRSLAERMAMNTPIQGTAADIIKLAMIRADRALREAGLKSRILLQVHDELVLEVTKDELSQVTALLQEAMEKAAELSVPLTIDINTGRNWAEAK